MTRARPRSQSVREQSALMRMLAGCRGREGGREGGKEGRREEK